MTRQRRTKKKYLFQKVKLNDNGNGRGIVLDTQRILLKKRLFKFFRRGVRIVSIDTDMSFGWGLVENSRQIFRSRFS